MKYLCRDPEFLTGPASPDDRCPQTWTGSDRRDWTGGELMVLFPQPSDFSWPPENRIWGQRSKVGNGQRESYRGMGWAQVHAAAKEADGCPHCRGAGRCSAGAEAPARWGSEVPKKKLFSSHVSRSLPYFYPSWLTASKMKSGHQINVIPLVTHDQGIFLIRLKRNVRGQSPTLLQAISSRLLSQTRGNCFRKCQQAGFFSEDLTL